MANGVYATLMTMLAAAPSMSGVSLSFGEEFANAQNFALPWANVMPVGGPIDGPAPVQNANVDGEMQWAAHEAVDVQLWAFDTSPTATEADHADATLTLRANVVNALQAQRQVGSTTDSSVAGGLWFKPISGRWAQFQGQNSRYGRAYVLTVQVEVPIMPPAPVDATVTTLTETLSITPPS